MVIFHSYVKLPEGKSNLAMDECPIFSEVFKLMGVPLYCWMLWNSLWKICNGWSGAKPILGNLHTAHPQTNADKLEIMAQDWCTNCSGRRNGWRNGWSSESRPSTLGGAIIPPFTCQINRSTTWFPPVIWGGNLEPWAIPAGGPLHMTLDAENTTMSWGMSTSWTKHEQTPIVGLPVNGQFNQKSTEIQQHTVVAKSCTTW
jgi:hypothetical protein